MTRKTVFKNGTGGQCSAMLCPSETEPPKSPDPGVSVRTCPQSRGPDLRSYVLSLFWNICS